MLTSCVHRFLGIWPNFSNGEHPVLCVFGGEASRPKSRGFDFGNTRSQLKKFVDDAEMYFHEGFWTTFDNFPVQPRSYARAEFVDSRF